MFRHTDVVCLCPSCVSSQCCVLHDLHFVNTGRGCKRLQTTQPRSSGAVTAVTNCCANCVEHSRPFTVFGASRACGLTGWLALLHTKADDVETNPGPTTLNKRVWICDICHKLIHVRKQISITHTSQHPSRPWSKSLHHPHPRNQNTRPILLMFPQDW